MPVAGGVLHSIELSVKNGVLREGAIMHRSNHVVITDVEQAIICLDAYGERPIYLKLESDNLQQVRQAFNGKETDESVHDG
jgi:hypothetical protein